MTQSEATGPVSPDPSTAISDAGADLAGAGLAGAGLEGTDLEGTDLEEIEAALLEADLRELAAERDELRGTAQRIQADFENYRKRVARDQSALADRDGTTRRSAPSGARRARDGRREPR